MPARSERHLQVVRDDTTPHAGWVADVADAELLMSSPDAEAALDAVLTRVEMAVVAGVARDSAVSLVRREMLLLYRGGHQEIFDTVVRDAVVATLDGVFVAAYGAALTVADVAAPLEELLVEELRTHLLSSPSSAHLAVELDRDVASPALAAAASEWLHTRFASLDATGTSWASGDPALRLV